jgi:hypothetical protein
VGDFRGEGGLWAGVRVSEYVYLSSQSKWVDNFGGARKAETRRRQVSPAWTEMRKGDRQGQHPPAYEWLGSRSQYVFGRPNSSSRNSVTTRGKTPLARSFPRGFGCFRPTRIRAQAQPSSASPISGLDPALRVHSRAIVAAAWAIVDVFQVEHRRYHLHVRAAAINARGCRGRAGRQAGRDVLCVRLGGCDMRCSHVASDELQRAQTAGTMMTRMPRPTFASPPLPPLPTCSIAHRQARSHLGFWGTVLRGCEGA